MPDILQDLSAPSLVHAIEANQLDLFKHVRCWPGAEVHAEPDLLWTMTRVPFPFFNSVLGARLSPASADAAIEAAIARGASRQVPIMWWTGPSTRPDDLPARLEAHGFVSEGLSPGMAADLQALPAHPPPPASLSIAIVRDRDSLRQFANTFCAGFDIPALVGDAVVEWSLGSGFEDHVPLHNYLGYWDGEPVATSSLMLGGGVAGIFNVCTLPQARRRGIGAALTLRPMLDARAQGYRAAILGSSEMGFPLYRRLGFQEYCKIGQYVWSPNPSHHAKH